MVTWIDKAGTGNGWTVFKKKVKKVKKCNTGAFLKVFTEVSLVTFGM